QRLWFRYQKDGWAGLHIRRCRAFAQSERWNSPHRASSNPTARVMLEDSVRLRTWAPFRNVRGLHSRYRKHWKVQRIVPYLDWYGCGNLQMRTIACSLFVTKSAGKNCIQCLSGLKNPSRAVPGHQTKKRGRTRNPDPIPPEYRLESCMFPHAVLQFVKRKVNLLPLFGSPCLQLITWQTHSLPFVSICNHSPSSRRTPRLFLGNTARLRKVALAIKATTAPLTTHTRPTIENAKNQ